MVKVYNVICIGFVDLNKENAEIQTIIASLDFLFALQSKFTKHADK